MENLTGGTPPVRYLLCVVPCKLYFKGDHFTNYPILLSSIIISVIPMLIVYLCMSDRLVSGMTQGAIKG